MDVTGLVGEAVAGELGRAVVLYVPHTTAGIVVQADGRLAVARDALSPPESGNPVAAASAGGERASR